ncbi:spore germination lipoprotein GerD [Lederbergia wuyishanensis]|uniref:Spore germination protein D n=1 Tax=Lederbergia wuyishanensis TaxID=1347903 RepID=A0ABU0DAN6_9BACI|nr:spore germination lipoprotein GerD [Lederbergia wuyishanensis]MCJ8009644.1 spore germination lipoprotein GerD [Lederbergia wuyishanensis]MDQ0345482.1 spore germination protein D [Lederbergia wuyishanensis]
MRKSVYLLLLIALLTLSSCSGNEPGNAKLDYDQTKKMMVDILKSDEGKKALQDMMKDEEMKQQLIMDQTVVKDTIEKTLTSNKGEDFWKKAMGDPKFAATVAKSMRKEHEALLKDLMKDPEYQGLLMDILQNPEMQKDFAKALKSKDFREQMQQVVKDTLDSPLYKAKIQELLLKAAEEAGKQGGKSENKDQGGGGAGSGGGGQ